MERNDLAPFAPIGQGTMFEGVLASPPDGVIDNFKRSRREKAGDWDSALALWIPNSLPLRSMVDCVDRLGINTVVFTLLPEESVPAIDRWLLKYSITSPVIAYKDIDDLSVGLLLNRSLHVLYTSSEEHQRILGPRSTVVTQDQPWRM